MTNAIERGLLVVAILASASSALIAQNPSTAKVEQALATRPGLAALVRARIGASGLSPDQIRSRLQAAGYPSSLLDAYMSASTDTSAANPQPDDGVMRAARFLGFVDSTETAATARSGASIDTVPAAPPEPPKAELPIFGLDLFRHQTSQFEPDLAGPVDATYRVGPRDVLALILTGDVETSYTLEVTREGFVVIPQVGQVYVANLTLSQINELLYDRLSKVYSGIKRGLGATTHFYVTVAKLRTNQVFVIGEVMSPASYQISSTGTIFTALYAAGGPADDGSLRDVQLRRGGKIVAHLDVYNYLLRGDATNDLRLENGDVIFVPVHLARVHIKGEVVRPAIYELASGETLRDLVQMAGGFRPDASRRHVVVTRILPPADRPDQGGRDRTVIDIASNEFATGTGPAFALVNGDRVEVVGISDRVRNAITIGGDVWSTGTLGYTPGMRLSDAIRQAGGVKPDVTDVRITRLQSDQSHMVIKAAFRDTLGTLAQDVPLQEDDSILVYGTRDFQASRFVVITGAVEKGGRYPWHQGMTLRDLVHDAHGLADGAYLVHAEVARIPESRQGARLSKSIIVPLDSTYLLERSLNGKYVGPPGVSAPAAKGPEFALEPYDNVLVLLQPDWQLERTVSVAGQVTFPGNYALLSKHERITSLLERAGGLTPRAYLPGAAFVRSYNTLGRVSINLALAIRDSNFRDNLILLPGDSLYIPPYDPTVTVQGAVNSPVTVSYVPGRTLTDYIDAAGGPTYQADANRAYVRQPNGIVDPFKKGFLFLPAQNPVPLPGSVIVVPTKDPNDRKDWTSIAGSVAQIVAGSIAIIAIVIRKP